MPLYKNIITDKYVVVAISSQYVIGKVATAFCVATPDELTDALNKAVTTASSTP